MEERSAVASTANDISETSWPAKGGVTTSATRICLVGNVQNEPKNFEAANKLSIPVITSDTGLEFMKEGARDTVFVLEEFCGPVYDALHEANQRILGPTALRQYAAQGDVLPHNSRPLYSLAMAGVVICITGFRRREEVARMMSVIHRMGGSLRNDMSAKVTHLVANTCTGEKYQYALTFRVPIVGEAWVHALWERRHDDDALAANLDMTPHKLKVFHGARVCFHGFGDEERRHMTEVLEENGGHAADIDDFGLTIVVVDSVDTYRALKTDPPALPTQSSTPTQAAPFPEVRSPGYETFAKDVSSDWLEQQSESKVEESFAFKTPTTTPRRKWSMTPDRRKSVTSLLADSIFKTPTLTRSFHRQSLSSFEARPAESPEDSLKSRKHRFSMRMFRPRKCEPIADVDPASISPSQIPLPPTAMEVDPAPIEPASGDQSQPEAEECQQELTIAPVVDDSRVTMSRKIRAPIVKAEWFWVSVQNEGCANEKDYFFEDLAEQVMSPGRRGSSQPGTPASSRNARKRKRLRDAVSRLAHNESPAVHKRRSSISDAGLLSMSGSFLDSTGDNLSLLEADEVESVTSADTPRKVLSPRQQVFQELVQTESNYVKILQLIMDAKQELDGKLAGDDPIVNATEMKLIFGNLPPIYEVHTQMLEELKLASSHWQEDTCVGRILLKYMNDLTKAYPPFVNFFEKTKATLAKCDREKVRFHAFLMGRQSRPDFCRQSVQDLLIRPVQRLPSISLLLNDILKHTSKSNADHSCLEKALTGLKEVMLYINEDKRKTEGQLTMFNIYNDIDHCPPDLVSSHRTFIARCDVVELSDEMSGRGDHLVLFLFSDTMEVCKRRSRSFNAMKSPTPAAKTSIKPFKHVKLMSLSNIKRVIDIRESEDCHNAFALICRSNQELKERTYSFLLDEETTDKAGFLNTLCRQTANTICKSDHRTFLVALDAPQLDIDTSSLGGGTIGKAFKTFARSKLKVSRAFSFSKTPLKRAVSSMLNASPYASTTNLTPASQLAQMRLASCSNLNELGASPKGEGTYIAPMSVQPTRKNKGVTQSLSVASLRRL